MKFDDLQSLIERRRSIRGYDEQRDVGDETIRNILNCARWAPSGGNGQPWEFLLVLGDPRVKEAYPIRTKLEKAESHFITGLANATLLIHLAASSLGLASQYVSDANSPYMETMVKALLKIPEPLRIYHLVPIGYAKGQVAAPPRRELNEMLHYESYDLGKFRSDEQMAGFVKTRTLQGAYGRRGGAEGNDKE